MQTKKMDVNGQNYVIEQIFGSINENNGSILLYTDAFERQSVALNENCHVIIDDFDKIKCCFIRLSNAKSKSISFSFNGPYQFQTCQSGGWFVKSKEKDGSVFWIPQFPMLRRTDSYDRILYEKSATIVGFNASQQHLSIEIDIPENLYLDCTIWSFPGEASIIAEELENLFVLEKQPVFLFSSHTNYQKPADLYKHLINGHIYENIFNWSHKRKICSELDAYSLYLALSGLELATNKRIYGLMKRQIVFSVIARQAEDGGWYHGEWTDLMESHYRLHCGAMLLLEQALEDEYDSVIEQALKKAAAFIARYTDNTQFGVWFLHDGLEQSAELMDQSGSRWIPSTILSKSPSNKMILNTHLDAIVTMDRYRECTGDQRYNDLVTSAAHTAEAVLKMKPADWLYRPLFWAIRLTLLPEQLAKDLPLPVRAVKRLAWKYLIPRLHIIKRKYPRFVMPGGIIERHLSPVHFNVRYQSVNIMDLTRYLRRFPSEQLQLILDEAIQATVKSEFLEYLAESKTRQDALAFWAEALYHVCMLYPELVYRRYLADAIINLEKTNQGLPPSLFGANTESFNKKHRVPCLLLNNLNVRIVNLSDEIRKEFLVINTNKQHPVQIELENGEMSDLQWFSINQNNKIEIASTNHILPLGHVLGIAEIT